MHSPAPERRGRRPALLALVALVLLAASTSAWGASPDGTLTIGVHVTLVNRWLDPAETEALITPFMVLYPLHDALVKPMPGNILTPSLAESWTASLRARVEQPAAGLIEGYPYVGPAEDLKLE